MNRRQSKRRVFLTDTYSCGNPVLSAGLDLLNKYGLSHLQIADTAEKADIILYLESGYLGLSDLPQVIRRVRAVPKAMHFLFSESDWPFPVLPGAYPSLSRPYPWAHSWSFILNSPVGEARHLVPNCDTPPEFLFSFLGRVRTHSVRKQVQMLDSPGTPCLDIEDAPRRFASFHVAKTYIDLIQRSMFVLCPRGFGVSSIRTFETMSLGRVPVVISDHWQPPPGIPWNKFCVVIRENDVLRIPAVLARLQSNAFSMGQYARYIYDENFAPNVFFDRLLAMLQSRYGENDFSTNAILRRAQSAFGQRELRTLFHKARHFALRRLRGA
jgi:hypothetical protein